MLSAVTICPLAVVNDGQLTTSVPVPGWPFARYTVPSTVVVLNVCEWATLPKTIRHNSISNSPIIPLARKPL
jgi:hypothetical protein